jgi:hypothetical protein
VTPRDKKLKPYSVMLQEAAGDYNPTLFECMAEDADHAEEQARNAYPDATVSGVTRTHLKKKKKSGVTLPKLRAVELATAHITQKDANILESLGAAGLPVDRHDYGFYIPISWTETLTTLGMEIKGMGGSSALVNILNLCVKQKASLLVLDRDATIVEGLEVFDW